MKSSGDKDFDAVVRRLEREFLKEMKGEKPGPEQIKEFWARVERARIRLVEKKAREATDKLVEDTFKYKSTAVKNLGNHHYWLKPPSNRAVEFTTLEDINKKLPDGKKVRALQPHQGGLVLIIY